MDGDVAEFAAYEGVLSKVKRIIVQNYLAAKYSSAVSLSSNDKYDHDSNHGTDVAGVGQASDGTQHLDAASAQLRIQQSGSSLSNGDYLLFGHDNQGFSFTTSEKPDGDPNRKVSREWRVDLTGASSQTVDVNVDISSLSQPNSKTNDYGLFVDTDGDGDFTTGDPTFYDLDGSGNATGVTLSDGDYVTVAAIQRTIEFASSTGADFENTGGGSLGDAFAPTLTATLNYPSNTSISSIDYTVTEVTSTLNEDTDGTFGNEGTNGEEDYRKTDGSFTFPSGTTTYDFNSGGGALEILNDSRDASTDSDESSPEDLDVNLSTGSLPSELDAGGTTTHTFSINDDDDPRKIAFSGGGDGRPVKILSVNPEEDTDPNADNQKGEENTVTTVSFEVALPEGVTGSASTYAVFEVTGAETDDFSIPANGDNNKLSDRRGEVQVNSTKSVNGKNTGYGTFDLTIENDGVFESDETVTVTLTSARSGTLDPDNAANLDFDYTIVNDDAVPTVSFSSSSDEGDESISSVQPTLNLSAAAEEDLTVDFSVAGSAVSGSDYTQVTSAPLTISAGQTSKTIDFTIDDDETQELEETIEVTIEDNATTEPTVTSPSTFTYTILDNDNIGATGPGGVGTVDGTSALELWLRGDAGSFTDTGCSTEAGDGNDVACWADQSGNGHDATQSNSGQRPALQTGSMNGRSVVRFTDPSETTDTKDGDGDYLDTEDLDIDATSGLTYFVVADLTADVSGGGGSDGSGTYIIDRPANVQPLVSLKAIDVSGSNKFGYQTRYDDGSNLGAATSTTNINGSAGNPQLVALQRDVGNEFRIFVGGAKEGTFSGDGSDLTPPALRIGSHAETDAMDGDISEVVVYGTTLNTTQRRIVGNYLAAKYGLSLAAGDKYAGDLGPDGVQGGGDDYDLGVFGIGRESSSDFHPAAEDSGLRFDVDSGLDDGDYLIAGHNVESNSVNTSDVSGVSGLDARMERTWYVDRTEPSSSDLAVDVTVDLAKAGLSGPAGTPASNYVLLTRDPTTSTWAEVASASSIEGANKIAFTGVSLTDGHEITLGTTDDTASPLDTDNLVITGTDGTDGADQGWRYLGLPVQSGTAGDLLRGDGSQFIDFDIEWMAYTNPGGDVQGSGTGWTAVQSASTALTNGRGFILWLYDDTFYPIDPSITLQAAGGLSEPGDNSVTVGNDDPTGDDPPLSTSDKQFLLSNPYTVPFDLGSLNGSGFDDLVQIWKPDATSPAGQDDANAGSFVTRSRSGGDDLSAWQGFLLTRSSTGSGDTQVTFNKSGRLTSATVDFVGSKAKENEAIQHRVPLRLVGRDADGNLVALDRAVSVLFHENARRGRDRFDAPKLTPMTGSYATLAPVAASNDTVLHAQESRPLLNGGSVRLPLSFQTEGISGTFEIGIPSGGEASTETPSIPENWEVELIDTKGTSDPGDDETHVLTPGGTPYSFEVTSSKTASAAQTADAETERTDRHTLSPPALRRLTRSEADRPAAKNGTAETTGSSSTRFRLEVRSGGALPVELAKLSANRKDKRAVLSWTTTSETNNAGFKVQHQRLPAGDTSAAPAASDWNNLGFVEGAGTTSKTTTYRFDTDALDYGRHAFRLKQVDADGTASPTEPVTMEMRLQKAYAVEAPYPNPARQEATLPVTVRKAQRVTVAVYDLLGRRVRVEHDRELPEQDTRRISISVRDLASGSYFVRVRGETFATTRRFTVVR